MNLIKLCYVLTYQSQWQYEFCTWCNSAGEIPDSRLPAIVSYMDNFITTKMPSRLLKIFRKSCHFFFVWNLLSYTQSKQFYVISTKNSPNALNSIKLNCKFGAETKMKICFLCAMPLQSRSQSLCVPRMQYPSIPMKMNLIIAHNQLNLFSLLTQI